MPFTMRGVVGYGLALLFGAGCGTSANVLEEGESDDQAQALAPAGSDSRVEASTIPGSMYPGERRLVTVTMRNSGLASPQNDWTTSNPPYGLHSVSSAFNWGYTYVATAAPVGAAYTFQFVLTAPPVSQTLKARMSAVGVGQFGETLTVPVAVDPSVVPEWGCTLVSSTIPAELAPGENRQVTVTVRNTGTATWGSNAFKLASRDIPPNLWGATHADLTTSVASGGTATFAFNLKAPAAPGTYAFARDMKDYRGIGDFRSWGLCVMTNITVGGQPPLDAAVVSHDFATTLRPGQSQNATVTMQNTGTEPWVNGPFLLYSLSSPVNLWGRTLSQVTAVTAPGATAGFSLPIKAPMAPGTYRQRWQMRKTSGGNAGFFGSVIDVAVTVPNIPQLDAAMVSHTLPGALLTGERRAVTVTMQNSGLAPWASLGGEVLASQNTPPGLWGVTSVQGVLEIPAGADRTFYFDIVAPASPGEYRSRWQMRQEGGAFFGPVVEVPIMVAAPPPEPTLDSKVVSDEFPAGAVPGQAVAFQVSMHNVGTESWTDDGTFVLSSGNTPAELWGPSTDFLPIPTAAPDVRRFDLTLTAPAVPGTYTQRWQMRKTSGVGAGYFGATVDFAVVVQAVAPGNRLLAIRALRCGEGGRAVVWSQLYPERPAFWCPSSTVCTQELPADDWVTLVCASPGETFTPRWAVVPSTEPFACGATFGDGTPTVMCDLLRIAEPSQTVTIGWEPNFCWPDVCF